MQLLSQQSIGDFYTKCASTLSDQLCNFRVVVVPHRFHFAIIVDHGISRIEEKSQTGLLQQRHPVKIPHSNSASLLK